MGDLSKSVLLFWGENVVEKSLNKIKPQNSTESKLYTYWAPAFAPDYSALVLASKMCTYSNKHSMYRALIFQNYYEFIVSPLHL